MKVKNLGNTSDHTCKCDSWLQHWENFSKHKSSECAVDGCNAKAEVGGHVQKIDENDAKWYIVPLCKPCNGRRGEELDVEDSTHLVSANVSETCEQDALTYEKVLDDLKELLDGGN